MNNLTSKQEPLIDDSAILKVMTHMLDGLAHHKIVYFLDGSSISEYEWISEEARLCYAKLAEILHDRQLERSIRMKRELGDSATTEMLRKYLYGESDE